MAEKITDRLYCKKVDDIILSYEWEVQYFFWQFQGYSLMLIKS